LTKRSPGKSNHALSDFSLAGNIEKITEPLSTGRERERELERERERERGIERERKRKREKERERERESCCCLQILAGFWANCKLCPIFPQKAAAGIIAATLSLSLSLSLSL
jgi:hypothetical protein